MPFLLVVFASLSAGSNSGDAARAVRGGARCLAVLWVEQFLKVHPRKLDRKIFADCPTAKIGSLENFQLYSSNADEHSLVIYFS